MERMTVMLLSSAAFSAACRQLLFRVGARGCLHWQEFMNLPILTGLLLYIASTAMWIYVLAKESICQRLLIHCADVCSGIRRRDCLAG